jgi:hypothetical protein
VEALEQSEPFLVDGDGRERYALRGNLGEGAVGRVHRAYDRDAGHEVALKTLKAVHSDHVYTLKQEFRSLRDLIHPSLVRLHELVVADELAYFTMELIDGVHLLDWIWEGHPPTEERPLDEEQLGRLRGAFSQLASALEALHARGRLHRDVKPSNVLVAADGRVVLVDLGISVDVGSALGRASMSGRVSGTRGYMSPEQASGQVLEPASDWYTFGVLLHQALTGNLPSGARNPWLRSNDAEDDRTPRSSSPSDLAELTAALLSSSPDARPTGAQVMAALPASRTSMWRRRVEAERLVGRDGELGQLRRALTQARASGVHVVTVTGPSGVGKTTLVETFLEQAAKNQDARVLRARCHHREKLPFKALDGIIDDLSEHLRQMPRSELADYVPARLGALLRVFPLLTRAFGVPAEGPLEDSGPLRPGALASLRNLLRKLVDHRPLILWVDDLQWADRDSLMALQAVVGPMAAPGYLVVLSYRGVGLEEQRFITELLEDVGAARRTEVQVGPLEAPDLLELVRKVAPTLSDPAVVQLVRTSGGMPLLAREFARDLNQHLELGGMEAEGKPLLSQLLLARLSQLPQSARTVFGLLCVAGFPIEERLLCSMVAGEETTFSLVDLALAGLLRDVPERGAVRLDVAHDQMREVYLEHAPEAELARLTEVLARTLGDRRTSDPLVQVEFLAQRAPEEALNVARLAAKSARERGAVQLEAALLERVATLATGDAPADVLADLGRALLCCGRSEEGAIRLNSAADLAQTRGEIQLATRWRATAGEHLMAQGHIQDGLAAMTDALAAIGAKYERSPGRALAWILLHAPLTSLKKALARYRPHRASKVSESMRVRMDVLWAAGAAVAHAEPIHAMQFHARHALLAYEFGDPANIALSTCEDAVIASMRGGARRWRRCREIMAKARALGETGKDDAARAFIEAQAAAMHYFAGEWSLVLEQAPIAHAALAAARSERLSQTGLLCFLEAAALFHLGKLSEVRARTAELKVALAASGNGAYEKCMRLGWTQMAGLAWDEIETAERDLLRGEAHLTPGRMNSFDYVYLLAQVNLELYQGRGASAFDLVEAAWPRVRRSMQLMLTVPHFDLWELRARAALAAASSGAKALRRLSLRVAERSIRALARNPLAMTQPAVDGLRASLALSRGSEQQAASHLQRAASRYEALELTLRANACRLVLGALTAGRSEGEARRYFEGEQVVYPERFVWVLLPAGPAPARQRAGSVRAEDLALQLQEHCAARPMSTEDTIISAPR